MHYVAQCGLPDPVGVLIEFGAVVNQKEREGKTPLMLAGEMEHEAVIIKLQVHVPQP